MGKITQIILLEACWWAADMIGLQVQKNSITLLYNKVFKGLLHYFYTFSRNIPDQQIFMKKKTDIKETPSKMLNPNFNYWHLKIMQIRF